MSNEFFQKMVAYYRQKNSLSYVKDGLILHLDGIDNTRSGHNANATAWEDLSGNNYDVTANGSVTFADDHVVIPSGSYFLGDTSIQSNAVSSVEIVLSAENSQSIVLSGYDNTDKRKYVFIQNGKIAFNGMQNKPALGAEISTNTKYSFSGYGLYEDAVIYRNGILQTLADIRDYWQFTGGYPLRISGRYGNSMLFKGSIYSVRIYNRTLSAQEIAKNYAVDKQRFSLT